MAKESVVCQIKGLTSPKGQKLNGLAASFDPFKPPQAEGRVAVTIDGVKGPPLAIKQDNLRILMMHEPFENLAVAVGRRDLRDQQFMATVVDQRRGKRITHQMVSPGQDGAMRSRGTLIALVDYFQAKKVPKCGNIVIHVTDLNLALLLNSYAFAGSEKTLESSQNGMAQKIRKQIIRNCSKNRVLLFKYEPFRIRRRDRPPKEMLEAVLATSFHIYPCPCETYLDALEVRYLVPGKSTHSFFLDYGEEEAIQYVQNVSSMEDDLERLQPEFLADADPQMFWSSVLHSKTLVKVLKNLDACPVSLIQQWTNIYSCYLRSVMAFKEGCFSPSEAIRILPDSRGRWNLINEKIHKNVATRNAKLAFLVLLQHGARSHPRIELMDNYKGSEIDSAVADFTKACYSKDPQDLEIALMSMTTWKTTKTCDYCGDKAKEPHYCARCNGALYCGEECQRSAWPAHKKVCKELVRTKQENLPTEQGKTQVGLYKPEKGDSYQERLNMFSEACGFGFLRILWCPSELDLSNVLSFKTMKYDTIFKSETCALQGSITERSDPVTLLQDADQIKMFNTEMTNLDPITRLCLACGPISNLGLAKLTLNAAMDQATGSVKSLKMPWVGFTPLEWAAKKGHLNIVQWLVGEPRTKPLLDLGAPVGWASYTGRVEVARYLVSHGASPEATNEGFWDNRPPLLAAAENGQLDAVKFLVEECGVSLSVKWKGNDIKKHIEMAPGWYELKGHKAVMKYVKKKLKK